MYKNIHKQEGSIKLSDLIAEQAFYITESLTPLVSAILYSQYVLILNNAELNPENIKIHEVNDFCFELESQAMVASWEHDEVMVDIDSVKSINIPGLYRIELDDNLPRLVRFWLIRGHELAKTMLLGLIDKINKYLERGVIKNRFEPIVGTTGEIIYLGEDEEGYNILKAVMRLATLSSPRMWRKINIYTTNTDLNTQMDLNTPFTLISYILKI